MLSPVGVKNVEEFRIQLRCTARRIYFALSTQTIDYRRSAIGNGRLDSRDLSSRGGEEREKDGMLEKSVGSWLTDCRLGLPCFLIVFLLSSS